MKLLRRKTIRATEGSKDAVTLQSSLLPAEAEAIAGVSNIYTTYAAQVAATYAKYNGQSEYGIQQTRAVIDLRTAFIAGEGISISCTDDNISAWITKFIAENKLNGSGLTKAIKGGEMIGQTIFVLSKEANLKTVKLKRLLYTEDTPYRVVYKDKRYMDEVQRVEIQKDEKWITLPLVDFLYVRTGGDDTGLRGATTKTGLVLNDIDCYDRALKDMRRLNHVGARITPVFETSTDMEAKNLKKWLQQIRWKMGVAFIGKAKFKYESPSTGALQNINSELAATIKTISAVTGVPVHWLGYVDLMANRATADSLYESIKNATINERIIWQEAFYAVIKKALEIAIDTGTALDYNVDFEVKLPLIDFNNFLSRVQALSRAYTDDAISIDDYRNALPGIDPLKTAAAVAQEQLINEQNLLKSGRKEW